MAEQIRTAIEGPLAGLGLLVEDITVSPVGRRRVIRIAVDRDLAALDLPDDATPVAPLSLDEVADATRAIEAELEPDDVSGPGPFVLEVSSPGVDRPLTEARHLRRNVGRVVTVRTVEGGELTGRIRAVSAEALLLDSPSGEVSMPVGQVRSARVQVEFGQVSGVQESAEETA
ncbi:MAG: ribosome maturation factor RimP [Dermatophilaceae bacterium]